jgi:CubicO group peptidase (beta-lactamase class C family)
VHAVKALGLTLAVALALGGCAVAADDQGARRPSRESIDDDPASPADDPASKPTPGDPGTVPQGNACASHQAVFDEAAAFVRAELEQNGVPGGSIAIVCGSKLAYAAGFGVKQQGGGEAVTEHTLFQLASTTKMLTAAAALELVDDAKLDLHAPLGQVVPALSSSTFSSITMHQLLSHTAGFPTEFTGYGATPGLSDTIQANLGMPLWAPPGAVFNYSNPGYALAGYVIEQVSATPFGQFLEQRLFQGTNDATMTVSQVLQRDHALGHKGQASSPELITPDGAYFQQGNYGPMGGAWGSAGDLARWAEAQFFGSQQLTSSAMSSAQTPTGVVPGSSYGYGLYVEQSVTPNIVLHGGGTPGFLSDVQIVPDAGVAVAVMVNADWYYPRPLTDFVLDRLVEFQPVALPPMAEAPAAWSDYVGSYVDEQVFGRVDVTIEGNKLMANFVDRGIKNELMHYVGDGYDVQYGAEGDIDFNFWRESPGAPVSYVVSLYGVAQRLP